MSQGPINDAEDFVHRICRDSFLSLWCYANPRAKPGKELCDILIVCDPVVVIVSVKDIKLNQDKDPEVAHARWERKAITGSVKQIYGAEGWLATATHVIRNDGTVGLNLPPPERRQTFRIAVAFGGGGEVVVKSEDFGEGFVNVMTEQSFQEVLTELDTVTDFIEYLKAKEALVKSGTAIVCAGSESNMLGWYITNGRSFPVGQAMVVFDETIWAGLQSHPDFVRRKDADQVSYLWDRLTETLSDPAAKPVIGPDPDVNQMETALRAMAREPRFYRRILGQAVGEFLEAARARRTKARIARGDNGIIYVFVYFSPMESPEMRQAELSARCYAARLICESGDTMVGIGLSAHLPEVGSASDLVYMHFPVWTAEDQAAAMRARELGFFRGQPIQHWHVDEYPSAT